MMRRIAAAAGLLLVAAPGPAQERRQPIEEVASDLAYGFCPLFLAGQFSLSAPELAARGFGPTVQRQAHPRFGEIGSVSAVLPDGEVSFGGASGRACNVVVSGSRREAALERLRATMSYTGLNFEPTVVEIPQLAGVTVETFKAPVDEQMLYVQLIDAGGPTPSVAAQLFVMEN